MPSLLPLGGVPGLGGLLGRAPPGLVVAVPGYGLREAGGEVGVPGLPAELAAELGAVDGVAAVVAGAVAHPVEVVLRAAEGLEDLAQHGDVVQLAAGADQVGLPYPAAGEDGPDGGAVVLGVDPVADALAVAVELGPHAGDEIRDLARDELLNVLVGPAAVRTAGAGDRISSPLQLALPYKRGLLLAGLNHVVSFPNLINMIARLCCPVDTATSHPDSLFNSVFAANPSP